MNTIITRIIVCVLALIGFATTAADYYVAPNGNDANPGAKSKPFATLQAAVNQLQPGDTLLIRGGTYRELVTFPRSGTAEKPITIKPYRHEQVVVTGCEPVTGWVRHKDNIWKAPMNWTLGLGRNQVFSGGGVMIEARYPNTPSPGLEMYVAGLSPLWPTFGEFSIPQETRTNQPGRIVSKLLENQPPDYWKGALYYGVHYEGWAGQTGIIESSKSGEIEVGNRTHGWWFGPAYEAQYSPKNQAGRGMIVGHLNALDQPGEWHWQDHVLYLIAPNSGEPRAVEAKQRQLAFDLSNRSHIVISGLKIHAASARLADSSYCTFDGCEFSYLSHYLLQDAAGQVANGRDTIKSGETGIYVSGHDNRFLNSSIRYSAGAGLYLYGLRQTIHNCLIDETSYTSHYMYSVTVGCDEDFVFGGHTITYNTLRNTGRSWYNYPGTDWSGVSRSRGPDLTLASLFAHNHCYNAMLQTRDAGAITGGGSSGGSLNGVKGQCIYNVMHDIYDLAAMMWSRGGENPILGIVYLDEATCDVDLHHNLLWAAPGSHQAGLWYNTCCVGISATNNAFYTNFPRNCSELKAEDFPDGKPFRFGHDFANPPPLPKWPQLTTQWLDAANCSALSPGAKKTSTGVTELKDGDWLAFDPVNLDAGWQSAILHLASTANGMNTDTSARAKPRHHHATDPLVLDSQHNDGTTEKLRHQWNFLYNIGTNVFVRFNQVPLGDGYRRFRVVYGNSTNAPARIEVHLDQVDGPLVGQLALPQTDKLPPRGQHVCVYGEPVGALAPEATGTHDVFLVFRSESQRPSIDFEYFRFEQSRGVIPLQKNEVKLELRAGSKDGPKLGEFYPRATGGGDNVREFASTLEPMPGKQPLFLVVRSALGKSIGMIAGISLEKSAQPLDWTGVGIPPLTRNGKMLLPEPTNRPQGRPNDQFVPHPISALK